MLNPNAAPLPLKRVTPPSPKSTTSAFLPGAKTSLPKLDISRLRGGFNSEIQQPAPPAGIRSRIPPLGLNLGGGGGLTIPSPRAPAAVLTPSPKDRGELLIQYRKVCSCVLENQIYLSGDAVARDLGLLKAQGITHIINAAGDTCAIYFPGKFEYLTVTIEDSRFVNEALDAILLDAISFIDQAVNVSKGKVLVHCREGVSRSCTLIVAYFMWKFSIGFNEALDKIKQVRSICNPNTGFTFALLKLQRRLEGGRTAEKRFYRVALHNSNAPFLVVQGVVSFDPSMKAWIPDEKLLRLDSRFVYLVREGSQIFVWKGHRSPAHLAPIIDLTVTRFIKNIRKYERIEDLTVHTVLHGYEPLSFWQSLGLKDDAVSGDPHSYYVHYQLGLDVEAERLSDESKPIYTLERWIWVTSCSPEDRDHVTFVPTMPTESTPRLELLRPAVTGRSDLSSSRTSHDDWYT